MKLIKDHERILECRLHSASFELLCPPLFPTLHIHKSEIMIYADGTNVIASTSIQNLIQADYEYE